MESESIVAASVSQPGISSACPSWASLPTDLLLDISGRLHDARDFLRFHAVCRPWRDAATSRLSPAAGRHTFLPWLISQPNVNGSLMHSPVIYFGGVDFSEATSEDDIWRNSHRYEGNALPVWSFSDTSWVASADGEAVWDFCLSPEPSLTDLVTRAVKRLPDLFSPDDDDNYDDLERRMRKPRGVFYADGTVLLYSFVPEENNRRYGLKKPVFTAAILRPGDMAWTIVEKSLNCPVEDYSCAAYHGGKVLVWVGTHFWCFFVVTRQQQQDEAADGGDIAAAGVRLEMTTCDEEGRYNNDHNYVLESCGELLWVSVLIEHEWIRTNTSAMCNGDLVVPALVVMVHALEEEEEEEEAAADDDGVGIGKTMRWVERDGLSLGDRLLFLGLPASFTMDAAQMGTDGGYAYFVYRHRVFRYNLVDGKTQCVDWPCRGWISPYVHVWLRPQPVIPSIQEIQ